MIAAQRLMLHAAIRRQATTAAWRASPGLPAIAARAFQPVAAPFSTMAMATHKPLTTSLTRRSTLYMTRGLAHSSAKRMSASPASSSSSTAAKTSAERRQEMVEKGKGHWAKLKDLWQKYGIVAVGTYFSMYGMVLSSIYVAIEQGWVSTAKTSRSGANDKDSQGFNLVTATNKIISLAEDLGIAQYLEVERVNSKTGSFLIAWVATKFTEPLRLALTIAVTPRIARLVGRAPKIVKAPKV